MEKLLPTGSCWCGCGSDVPRGKFFLSGHDKRAESAVIQLKYGSIPEFLQAMGYGPGGKNPTEALTQSQGSQGGPGTMSYSRIPEGMLSCPVVRVFQRLFGNSLLDGGLPSQSGEITLSTLSGTGWTLRVFAPGADMKSASLLWDPNACSESVRVPASDHLQRCFPAQKIAVDQYVELFDRVGANIGFIGAQQSLRAPEENFLTIANEFCDVARRLAGNGNVG